MPSHPLFRFALISLLLILGVYVFLCLVLFSFQRKLIYLPPSKLERDSSAPSMTLSVPEAELAITTREMQSSKALIYFGGNAEEVSYNLFDFSSLFPNSALYLTHYRGYGGSSGSPSQQALFSDALAVYDHVVQNHPEIVVMGRSLGSGVACYLASQRTVSQLILITPFDSLENIAAQQFPIFPVRWMLLDPFRSIQYVPQIKAPTMILAAEFDEIIPLENTMRLQNAFRPNQSHFILVHGADHNTLNVAFEVRALLESKTLDL